MPSTYNASHKLTLGHLKALAQRVYAALNAKPAETWTFVLEDDSEVEKQVSAWTSGT